jgi:hypothetical protein
MPFQVCLPRVRPADWEDLRLAFDLLLAIMGEVPADAERVEDDLVYVARLAEALSCVGEALEAARLKDDILLPDRWTQHTYSERWFRKLLSFAFEKPLLATRLQAFLTEPSSLGRPGGDPAFFGQMTNIAGDFSCALLESTRPRDAVDATVPVNAVSPTINRLGFATAGVVSSAEPRSDEGLPWAIGEGVTRESEEAFPTELRCANCRGPLAADDIHEGVSHCCRKCRDIDGSLAGAWALFQTARERLDNCPHWPAIRQLCCERFPGHPTFTEATFQCLLDWLHTEHGLHREAATALPLPEAVELLRRQDSDGNDNREAKQPGEARPNDGSAAETKLAPSRQKAYSQFCWAIQQNTALTGSTDRSVYDWLTEHLDDGEQLPAFATWCRYLRVIRAASDARRNTPRVGRELGRSIARSDQI